MRWTRGYGVPVRAVAILAIVASTQAEQVTSELPANVLTNNLLLNQVLIANALTANALTSKALAANTPVYYALNNDPNARELLNYIVSCALPPSEVISLHVANATYDYNGELGLAPEWGQPGGRCNGQCRSWISGCVIARLGYLGTKASISLRGSNPALLTSLAVDRAYTDREAAYYGDIFSQPQKIYACLSPGQTEVPRVCGPSIANCAVHVVSTCDKVCVPFTLDGAFIECQAAGQHYLGSVTVFLNQSSNR